VDGKYFDMGGNFGGGSNWLQPRPSLIPIPTQLAQKINSKQENIFRYDPAPIHKNLGQNRQSSRKINWSFFG